MKRIISISLLTLILLAGSRIAINLHYCGGELASVEFFAKKKDTCNKCGMKKSKSCCQDVTKVFSSQDFNSTNLKFDFEQQLVALPAISFVYSQDDSIEIPLCENVNWANAPPNYQKEPLYILNRSFIV
ncbi:MAG: hypothetical protein H7329_06225 [Opitutaceae bacterium]|nr:hypothetical protein [Cytophagales bacterium]